MARPLSHSLLVLAVSAVAGWGGVGLVQDPEVPRQAHRTPSPTPDAAPAASPPATRRPLPTRTSAEGPCASVLGTEQEEVDAAQAAMGLGPGPTWPSTAAELAAERDLERLARATATAFPDHGVLWECSEPPCILIVQGAKSSALSWWLMTASGLEDGRAMYTGPWGIQAVAVGALDHLDAAGWARLQQRTMLSTGMLPSPEARP